MHIPINFNQEHQAQFAYHHHQKQSPDPETQSYIQALEERKEAATRMLLSCGFEVVHQHGQRISTNVMFNEAKMQNVDWNEIFIGKLPRDMFEDELVPHLLSVGVVYKIRYMMDFSGTNRGFCFVKYANTLQAIQAIRYLDGLVLREDKPAIGAKMSFDNKCLFIGNIPISCTSDQLQRALEKAEVSGITSVRLAGTPKNTHFKSGRKNHHHNYYNQKDQRGYGMSIAANQRNQYEDKGQYGYVYFETHDDATRARRILLPGEVKLQGRKLTLDWAKSEIPAHISQLLKPPAFIATDLWSEQGIVSPSWQSLVAP